MTRTYIEIKEGHKIDVGTKEYFINYLKLNKSEEVKIATHNSRCISEWIYIDGVLTDSTDNIQKLPEGLEETLDKELPEHVLKAMGRNKQ